MSGKHDRLLCQPNLEMSSFSPSRHVRFYVPAAAAWLVRSGRRRVRHGWSGLGVTGRRGRCTVLASAAFMGRDVIA